MTDSGTGGVTDPVSDGGVSTSDLSDTAENTEFSTENTETEDVSASSHEAGTDELAHTGASGVTGPVRHPDGTRCGSGRCWRGSVWCNPAS